MTSTKAFGVGRREGHDASGYYGRRMVVENRGPEGTPEIENRCFVERLSPISGVPSGPLSSNVIHQADAREMHHLPDESVALAFTSPPYNVGKEYDGDLALDEYLALIRDVGYEVYRVLRPGGGMW